MAKRRPQSEPRPMCAGTTAKGAPCGNRAKAGSDYCASHLGTVGRHTRLTPEVHVAIVQALQAGAYQDAAATAAGVGVSTYYAWLERGEADLDAGLNRTPYAEFREAVSRARASAEVTAIATIQAIGLGLQRDGLPPSDPQWRALAWFLERTFPSKYGRREHVEHSMSDGPTERIAEQVEDRRAELMAILGENVAEALGNMAADPSDDAPSA